MELVALTIVAAYGLLLSYLAFRGVTFTSSFWFYCPALMVAIALAFWALKLNARPGMFLIITCIGVGMLVAVTHGYFFAAVVGNLVSDITTFFTGDNQLVVKATYDRAEAAAASGDIELAMRLYADAAQTHPDEPTPRLRLAELCTRQGQFPQAVQHLKDAIDLARDPANEQAAVFRLADLLANKLRRPDAAREALQSFIHKHPGTKPAELARERIKNLS